MKVDVKHRLTGVAVRVEDCAEAPLAESAFLRKRDRAARHFADERICRP